MSQTVQESGKQLLPLRHCTFCQEQFAALHLTWVGGQWFCKDCHKRWIAKQTVPEEYANLAEEAPATPDRLKQLHRIDTGFRYGTGVARFSGYGVGFYMATKYSFVDHLLHGVVLADILTWVFLCWFDARFHRLPVFLEFIGFVALTTLVLGGGEKMSQFESNSAMGMAFLGFLVTFATKGTYQMYRYWTQGTAR